MLFREIEMTVEVGEQVTFRFAEPLSIEVFYVARIDDEVVLWDFLASEFQPASPETTVGSFQTWPIDEAPAELLAMLAQVQEQHERELAEHGPNKPPLPEVRYGELPDGYREKVSAGTLTPGQYSVSLFSEQGRAAAHFTIPGLP